jgi:hypothetical protein
MTHVLLLLAAAVVLFGGCAAIVNLGDTWLDRRAQRSRERRSREIMAREQATENKRLREQVRRLEEEIELRDAHERYNEEARGW